MQELKWVPTPSFLYRNYLYLRIARSLPSNTYFLDIGSGNGDFVKKMLSLGFKGESLDYSPKAVSFMRRQMGKNPNINIRLGNIFTFKSQKKFDTIFAFETLEHIKDDGPCMEKIFQLLKPGGMFIMSVPAHMSLWDKVDELKGHFRRYEKNDLVSQIEKTGFLLQKFWCYGFPFLNLIRLISGSGALIESPVPGQKTQRTEESSIQLEYNPILAHRSSLHDYGSISPHRSRTRLYLGSQKTYFSISQNKVGDRNFTKNDTGLRNDQFLG